MYDDDDLTIVAEFFLEYAAAPNLDKYFALNLIASKLHVLGGKFAYARRENFLVRCARSLV